MARKKKEEASSSGSPAWMATFSDLMNLLLCFFVLLFSMSSVDQGKAEALIESLAQTFSIFEGGGASFGNGNMISNGADQLSNLDDYFNTMGQTDDGDIDQNVNENENGGDSTDHTGAVPSVIPTPSMTPEEIIEEKNKEESSLLYGEVMDKINRVNLGDYIDIGIDSEAYHYITIEIKGHLLFESGDAALVEEAKPIISKIGDVLKQYNGYRIEVIGHTDIVPQTKAPYYNNDVLSFWRARSVALYLIETCNIAEADISFTGKGEREPIASNDTEEGRKQNRRVEIRLYNKNSSND